MTGMTSHRQHHWSFFSQVGNEDVSQEAEKDLLCDPSIGFVFLFVCFFLGGGGGGRGRLQTPQCIETRVPGVGEDQQW